MEEAKKMKCYKRLIFKQFVQVSGLCGPKFLSYLPKRFTHLCKSFVWRRHVGAPFWCSNMAAENNENIWSSLFLKKLFLFTRQLAYVRINKSSNTWNGYTIENQEDRLFSTRQHSNFGLTHCENSEVQIAVFSKWNMLRKWRLVQKIYFLFIFNLVYIRIRKTALFWLYNLMTSLWKPSIVNKITFLNWKFMYL